MCYRLVESKLYFAKFCSKRHVKHPRNKALDIFQNFVILTFAGNEPK